MKSPDTPALSEVQKLEQLLAQARQELARAAIREQTILEFFRLTLGYEVREPVNRMTTAATLFLHEPQLSEEQREILEIIQSNGHVIHTIINTVITGTQVETGLLTPSEEEVYDDYPYTSLDPILQDIALQIEQYLVYQNKYYASARAYAATHSNYSIGHDVTVVAFIDQRTALIPPISVRLSFAEQIFRLLLSIIFHTPLISAVLLESNVQETAVRVIIGWKKKGGEQYLYEKYQAFEQASSAFTYFSHPFTLYIGWEMMRQCQGTLELDVSEEDTTRIILSFPRKRVE